MPSGQSHTTWFPELKVTLKTHWKLNSKIEDHFALMNNLNTQLNRIRKELKVKPPTFFCKHCNVRHEGKLTMVTITSMYFALEKFEIINHKEHLELKRNWRKYSKKKSINIHGSPIDEEKKSRKHNKVSYVKPQL